MASTATDSQQPGSGARESTDGEAFKARVQLAFALGWHVAELWSLPQDVRDPSMEPDPLAPAPDLDYPTRARLLVDQISADLDRLGIQPPGGIRPVAVTGAPSSPGSDPKVDEQDEHWDVAALHRSILLPLTVRSAELGKAYSVGVGLARVVLEAYEEAQPALIAAAAASDPGGSLGEVKKCVGKGFTEDRVRALWSEIKDLKSRFPPYAADPIAAGLSDWCNWAGGSQIKRGQPSDSEQVLTVSYRLRRQGQIWRALLSGERKPTDVLLAANFVDGAIDLVRKYSSLVVRTLGANLGTLLAAVFAAAVLGVSVVVLQKFNNSALTWIAGLLAALGVTGAGILATLKSLVSKAEQALWETELTAAIGVSINYVPALLADSEVEKLRDDNPGPNKGPVVKPVPAGPSRV
jgi:hypothetical protein